VDHRDATHQLSTPGIATGCITDTRYENATHALATGDVLYLYSDGLYELSGQERRTLSCEELEDLFSRSAKATNSLDALLAELEQFNGSARFADDVSVLEVRIP
jgi:sigma-B regulation protein RsbU (phosphoserine phosphatase)